MINIRKFGKELRKTSGQMSIEYMALVVMFLAILAALAIYGQSVSQTERRGLFLSYCESNLDKISASINALASAGKGDTNTIRLYYPEDPFGQDIKLKCRTSSTINQIYYSFDNKDVGMYRPENRKQDNSTIEGTFSVTVSIKGGSIKIKEGYTNIKLTKTDFGEIEMEEV